MGHNNRFSRRNFMQYGLVAAGGIAAAPVTDLLAPASRTVTGLPSVGGLVGALIPETNAYPQAAADLLSGIQGALDSHAVLSERITVQTDSAVRAAQALLDTGMQMLVGMVSPAQAEAIQPMLSAYGASLVVATAGAQPDSVLENVYTSTLGYWQSTYAAGQWAAGRFGGRGMLVASFYESGFEAVSAFDRGLDSAGGEMVASWITHTRPTAAQLASALSDIRATRPDFVYAAYLGRQAAEFLAAYRGAGLTNIPLVVSPFMADADSFATVAGWTGDVSPFAALGQQTGQWVAAGLNNSPAGYTLDRATRTLSAGLTVREGGRVVQRLALPSISPSEAQTGWTFAYGTV
ncbi:MAG: ABC transporter substrate-binding protein [Anaerolineae bacterium]|nr:ABC transporter substrate-binding protein [Anaerolineae bacterium]